MVRPSVLAQIRHEPTAVGVLELAALMGVSAPSMTRYLDRMESRRPDRALSARRRTCRRIRLALTPKGVRALRSVRSRRTAWLASPRPRT